MGLDWQAEAHLHEEDSMARAVAAERHEVFEVDAVIAQAEQVFCSPSSRDSRPLIDRTAALC